MAPDFMKGRSQAGNRGDMVALYDWVVGELLATLQRLNIADNTLVIVTSDNGARLTCADGNDYGHKSCGDLRGQKADIWDGGHREPLIVRWPGRVKPGTTCDQTVCLLDFIATFAAVAGAELDDDDAPDSYNILPAILGQADKPIREAIVHHSVSGMFSIRQGPWKLIFGLGSGGFSKPRDVKPAPGRPGGQLYNMADDPAETQNLWRTKPEIVERLTALLENYRTEGRSRPQKR
jgi:arylsulfatase A-like enzyme